MENGESGEKEFELEMRVTKAEAIELEKTGFKTVDPLPPSQISEDLRKEIIRVLTKGDEKKKGAFTVAVASHLERLIHAAKQILMAEKIASNDVGALLKNNQNPFMGGGGFIGPAFGQMMGIDDATEEPLVGIGGKGNENFGVQVIKELISAARTFNDSPVKTIEALAVARKEGLTDVVASLEAKLGLQKLPPTGDGSEGAAKEVEE